MKIEEILRFKGDEVITIAESQSVLDAVQVLVDRNIGGLVVTEGQRPTGIFTERDILRLAARGPEQLASILVGTVMTRDMITASPQDDLAEIMDAMTENRIRHLPVIVGEELAGIISIGDVVNAHVGESEFEIRMLKDYVQGRT